MTKSRVKPLSDGPLRGRASDGGSGARDLGLAAGWIFGIPALVGLLVRSVYLFQIREVPFIRLHVVDAAAYDEWAKRIAGGDWLGSEVFYQAPLYPYFLAVLKLLVGDGPMGVRVVQIALGAVACGLMALAGRGWALAAGANRRDAGLMGLMAGGLLALYAPAVFFDALIQKSVLDGVLGAGLLWCAASAWRHAGMGALIGAGALAGLLALSRETALLLVAVLLGLALVRGGGGVSRGALRAAGVLCGAALVLLPVAVRNAAVGGEFALTTSQAGPNFFIGNNPEASGVYKPLRPGRGDPRFERTDATELAEAALGRTLSPGEVSAYWLSRGLSFVAEQPLRWLGLTAWKAHLTFHGQELPDAEDIYYYAEHSWLLRALLLTGGFGLIAPLAALGLVWTLPRWRSLWVLHAFVIALAAGTIVFYVFARYRHPLSAPLMVLAALGLWELVRRVGMAGGMRSALPGLIVAAAVAVWCNVPLGGEFSRTRLLAGTYSNAAAALSSARKPAEALRHYGRALELDPLQVEIRVNYALALGRAQRPEDALRELMTAARQDPKDVRAAWLLGTLLAERGQVEQAVREPRRAIGWMRGVCRRG
ncbi:MAG: tetratricopeptide repeat protein [Phycisphaerales bacterium]|nr:tetratricopeptide repeat protein [Phycisphaerales bacterium]